MKAQKPLALMIVQELERLRHDMAEISRLVPSPREVEAVRAKEVGRARRLPAQISASSKRA
jgi:hypothetical protein